MTRVAILPISTETGGIAYVAVAGERHSQGSTAGEALDAITAQLPEDKGATLVIVQSLRADSHFAATQVRRLGELMARWRAARDTGNVLSADEEAELKAMVDAELRAAASRASAMAAELGR